MRRFLVRLLLFFAGMLATLYFILQIPAVQTALARQAAKFFAKEWGTVVRIDRLKIKFFTKVELEGVYMEDLAGDTLLYVRGVQGAISNFSILHRTLYLSRLELDCPQFDIRRRVGEKQDNFQFIISYFNKGKQQKKSSSPAAWEIGFGYVSLQEARFLKDDEVNGDSIRAYLPKGEFFMRSVNFAEQSLAIAKMILTKPECQVHQRPARRPADYKPDPNKGFSFNRFAADTTQAGFRVEIGHLEMQDGSFVLNNLKLPKSKLEGMDYAHLDLRKINLAVEEFLMQKLDFGGYVSRFTAEEQSGMKVKQFYGDVNFTPTSLSIYDFKLKTDNSEIGDTIMMRYKDYSDWLDFVNEIRLFGNLKNASITFEDIFTFAPQLRSNRFFFANKDERLQVNGKLRGTINGLRGRDVQLTVGDNVYLKTNFSFDNITRPADAFFDMRFDELRANINDLALLIPNYKLPPPFQKLGNLRFEGSFTGFLRDFVAAGILKTDLGEAQSDIKLVQIDGPEQARYSGEFAMRNFQLGKMFQVPNLGAVSFSTNLSGSGLAIEQLTVSADGIIQLAEYKGYAYTNVIIDGGLEKRKFVGKCKLNDNQASLELNGLIDFNNIVPRFDLRASVKHINFQALNLTDEEIEVAGLFNLDFSASNIDNFVGVAVIEDVSLCRNGVTASIDSVEVASSVDSFGFRSLTLQSDFATASATGKFQFSKIANALLEYTELNFPSFAHRLQLYSNALRRDTVPIFGQLEDLVILSPLDVPEQDIRFEVKIEDTYNFTELVSPSFHGIKGFEVSGLFNNTQRRLKLDAAVEQVHVGAIKLNGIKANALGKNDEVAILTSTSGITIGDNTTLPSVAINAALEGDTLNFSVQVKELYNVVSDLSLRGVMYLYEGFTEFKVLPSDIYIFQKKWRIAGNNFVRFNKESVQVDRLLLRNEQQFIVVTSEGKRGLSVQFENIDVPFISQKLNLRNFRFGGTITAGVSVRDLYDMSKLDAYVQMDDFIVNNENWGELDLNVSALDLKSALNTSLNINGKKGALLANGTYTPPFAGIPIGQHNDLDFTVGLTNVDAKVADYFLKDLITDTKGVANAFLELDGNISKPSISGEAKIENGSTKVVVLNTEYRFKNITVPLSSRKFAFNNQEIEDFQGNKASVNGAILHDHFRNIELDLAIRSENILALNTDASSGQSFYGRAYAKADVAFTGPLNRLNLNIAGRSNKGTQIALPLDYENDAKEVRFVEFIDKKKEAADSLPVTRLRKVNGINIEMLLDITPDAEMAIILDERAGDIMRGRGRGTLLINFNPDGELSMNGQITLIEGSYLFTFQGLVNKPFVLRPGGTITWRGDPFDAQLNIAASYTSLRVPTYDLIANFIEGQEDLEAVARTRTPVELTMKLSGAMMQPDIDFDIQFQNVDSRIKGLVETALRNMKDDKNNLSRQVFGLIALGHFLPTESATASTGGGSITGRDAFNTLSEMLSSQLSMYISDFLSDVVTDVDFINDLNFNFRYNTYDDEQLGLTGSEMQIGFSNSLFNNRVNLNVGGNIDFANPATTTLNPEAAGAAQIAGDFVLEYLLTPDGRLKIRAFNRGEPNILQGNVNRSGVGLSYRREFNTLEEFLDFFRKSNNKKQKKRVPAG